jgi:hypothetical protein
MRTIERLTHRTGSKTATLLLAGIVLGGSVSACGGESLVDPNAPGLVLSGTLPYGHVELYQEGDSCIKGQLPHGKVRLCQTDNTITGESPWGKVNANVQDGHITGKVPYGKLNVQLENNKATGSIPYGAVDLGLNQKILSGRLPYGNTLLQLGGDYSSLEEPLVVDALVAVFSDKT